ncbi:MAG: hypothetical protein ABJ327_10100 [Litoreibacter sp.]
MQSTVRSGADLGFNMRVVADAIIDFDLPSANLNATTIFEVSIALMKADFAQIVETSSGIE